MASTRNKNTVNNYTLELKSSVQSQDYNLYKEYGIANDTEFAGNGLGNAQLPRNHLSDNCIDTESFLRGIRSTDLTRKEPLVFTPECKSLETKDIYKKSPTMVPPSFVSDKTQRPLRE
tara:strand:+ start:7649 stop:8002 length:354 start_codon:yes stop_codon:yes gene_type:complete